MTLVLASGSPQQRAILEQIGVAFTVRPSDVEEETQGDPVQVAEENARRKALAVPGELVLGADTLVAIGGPTLGKPAHPPPPPAPAAPPRARSRPAVTSGTDRQALDDRGRSRTSSAPPGNLEVSRTGLGIPRFLHVRQPCHQGRPDDRAPQPP